MSISESVFVGLMILLLKVCKNLLVMVKEVWYKLRLGFVFHQYYHKTPTVVSVSNLVSPVSYFNFKPTVLRLRFSHPSSSSLHFGLNVKTFW